MIALTDLARTTLTAPQVAARNVIAVDLSRDVLWTALVLVAAVNAILLYVLFSGASPDVQARFPSYFASPLMIFVLLAGVMVIYIHSAYWAGLSLGGQGRLDDMLALLVWLQVLRTLIQLTVIFLTFALPAMAGPIALMALVWSTWVLLTFVKEALDLPTKGHALVALFMAVIGLVLGLGVMVALIGLVAQGTIPHV